MSFPVSLMIAAVMFWGWQIGQPWLACAVAALLALPGVFSLRMLAATSLLKRLSDLCTLAFAALVLYLFISGGVTQAIIEAVQWMPLILLPLFLAILYGGMRKVDLSVISVAMRRSSANRVREVDLGYPYFALWLLAASVSNRPGPGFYAGLSVLVALALWRLRPAGRTPLVWGMSLLCAVGIGLAMHSGIYRLQDLIEQAAMEWIGGDGETDPQRTQTSLGHIGELKLSDSIALRIRATGTATLPILLRTASYNVYAAPSWIAAGGEGFAALRPDAQTPPAQAWLLGERASTVRQLEIAAPSSRRSALLALPHGALRTESTHITRLARNRVGTVQADIDGGHHVYRVDYDPAYAERDAPVAEDLRLPRGDGALLIELAQRLQLAGKPQEVVLRTVKNYFADNFSYSTFRSGNAPNRSAVADFLLRNRTGHCEHFATATVLLLRAAGIPARYAVGYSVQERDRFGEGYVARRRDAHAWVRAYVDGAWRDVDTTPATWAAAEQKSAPFWEPLLDAWSWLVFQWQTMRLAEHSLWIVVIGLVALAWLGRGIFTGASGLVRFARRMKQAGATGEVDEDSAFYRIEALLAERGLARPSHEALGDWLARIAPQIGEGAHAGLRHIVALHYRCRFGPRPVPDAEQRQLRDAADAWIALNVPTQSALPPSPARTGSRT